MLLAIDTSSAQLGLALYDGAIVIAELTWTSPLRHTAELAPALTGLLERVGRSAGDLSALAVAIGPGSFTSLRVGLAFAKGLALACTIPLFGVGTLDIVAASVPVQNFPLAAVMQAGRGRIAVGWYAAAENHWQAQGVAETMSADELAESIQKPTLVVGELNAEERARLARKRVNVLLASAAQSVRRAAWLAELAWTRLQNGESDDPASLAPIYLKTADGPL